MATWTDIPNASLEPGAPARSVDAISLRDNDVYLRSIMAGTETEKVVDARLSTTATTTGRDWVLARTALATAHAVGTYALGIGGANADFVAGSTYAGSSIVAGFYSDFSAPSYLDAAGGVLSGTWMALGTITTPESHRAVILFLRVA